MKRFKSFSAALVFAALCVCVNALFAQTYYEGEGGKDISISVETPADKGLDARDKYLLERIKDTFASDFGRFAGMKIYDIDGEFTADYIMTGAVTRTPQGLYDLSFIIKDRKKAVIKASYSTQCTYMDLQTMKSIKDASEALIAQMGVRLTAAGKDALRKASSDDVNAYLELSKSFAAKDTAISMYHAYNAERLGEKEASGLIAAWNTNIEKAATVKPVVQEFKMPEIKTPQIKMPEYKTPQFKPVETGSNIGTAARAARDRYRAEQKAIEEAAASRGKLLSEFENSITAQQEEIKKTFESQYKAQMQSVPKQQDDILKQRGGLLAQQPPLLSKQKEIIAFLRDTENLYESYFEKHPPFEIIYDPKLEQVGKTDVKRGVVNMQFTISSIGTAGMLVIPKMLDDVKKNILTIKKGFADINAEFDVLESQVKQLDAAVNAYRVQMDKAYRAQADGAANQALAYAKLLDKEYVKLVSTMSAEGQEYAAGLALGKKDYAEVLARAYSALLDRDYVKNTLAAQYGFTPSAYRSEKDKVYGDVDTLTKILNKWGQDKIQSFVADVKLSNDKGKTIGRSSVTLNNEIFGYAYQYPRSDSAVCMFRDIPIDDIGDSFVITMSVNGRDMTNSKNADYIKISAVGKNGRTPDGLDIDGYNSKGVDCFGFAKNYYDSEGYNMFALNRGGQKHSEVVRLAKQREDERRKAERKDAARQFAQDILVCALWGALSIDPKGEQWNNNCGFIGGMDFGFRFKRPSYRGALFPVSFITEAYFLVDAGAMEGNFGGGLMLDVYIEDLYYFPMVALSVSGGVSLGKVEGVKMNVPYLRINASLAPFTGGVIIHFYSEEFKYQRSSIVGYVGLKFLIPLGGRKREE